MMWYDKCQDENITWQGEIQKYLAFKALQKMAPDYLPFLISALL